MRIDLSCRHPGLAPLTLLLVLAAGCSGDEPPAPHVTPPEVLAPDTTTFQVVWKPTTRVLDEATVKGALEKSSPATGEFTFRGGVAAIEALQPGEVAVLPGVGLFKIVSNTETAGKRVLVTTLAALTDAIADGNIAWSIGVHGGNIGRMVAYDDLGKADSVFTNGKLSYSGTLAGWATTFTLTAQGDDFLVEFAGRYDKGASKIHLVGKGTMRGFRNEANIIIKGSSMTDFLFAHKHLEGDLELEIGGVELSGETVIKIPARIAFPFTLGPLPAFTSVGGTFEVSSTLKGNASNIAKAKFHFRGAAGLGLSGGKLVPRGQLEEKTLSYESGSAVGIINAGLGALFQFPQVDFGIGTPGTEASVFLKIKQEIVSNFELRYEAAGPYPVITGNCLKVNVNLGGYVGGALKAFGFTLAEKELTIFTYLNPLYKKGDACDG